MNPAFQALTANEIAVRIFSSVVAGTLIGLERLFRHKVAGLKTNTLVCMGAAMFGMISSNSQRLPNWAGSQFVIGVITGVGFLGSGIIIQSRGHVQGVNSAATIWVASGVGLALGMGEIALGFASLASILVVQFTHRKIEARVNQYEGVDPIEH
jgi:putative Mg2+ transporter-C (MgtC) family protein